MANRLDVGLDDWKNNRNSQTYSGSTNRLNDGLEEWKKKRKPIVDQYNSQINQQISEPIVSKPVDQVQHEKSWSDKSIWEKAGATFSEIPNTIGNHYKKVGQALEQDLGTFQPTKNWEDMSFGEKTKATLQEAKGVALQEPVREILNSEIKFGSAISGIGEFFGVAGSDSISAGLQKYQQDYNKGLAPRTYKADDNIFDNPSLLLNPEYISRNVIEQLPNLAVMTKTKGWGEGVLELGSAFSERTAKNRQAGRENSATDRMYAGTIGIINGFLGKIGFDMLFEKNPAIKKAISAKVGTAVTNAITSLAGTVSEMGTEYIQEVIPQIATKIIYDEGGSWLEVLAEANKQGKIAASAAGVVSTPISVMNFTQGVQAPATAPAVIETTSSNGALPPDRGTQQNGAKKTTSNTIDFLTALHDDDQEAIKNIKESISNSDLEDSLNVLTKAKEQAPADQVPYIEKDIQTVQSILQEKESKVKDAVGRTIVEGTSDINNLTESDRKDAIGILKKISQTSHESAGKAQEILDNIESTNKISETSLQKLDELKKEFLAEKKSAEDEQAKKDAQAKIDKLDSVRIEFKKAKNTTNIENVVDKMPPHIVRDTLNFLDEKLYNLSGDKRKTASSKINVLRDKYNEYNDKNSEKVFESKNTNVSVVRYPDGKWSVQNNIHTNKSSSSVPFNGVFNNKQEAIASVLDQMQKFIDNNEDDKNISDVKKDLEKLTKMSKSSITNGEKTYEKPDNNTRESDNGGEYAGSLQVGENKSEVSGERDKTTGEARQDERRSGDGANGERVRDGRRLTQKESVKLSLQGGEKSISEIAEETKILEPNVRRILGVGTKEGIFSRIEKGVYVLSKDGVDTAWIEAGNAIDVLPRLVEEGVKFDAIYSDLPYESGGNIGGNRPLGYVAITPDVYENDIVSNYVKLLKDEDSTIIHIMTSGKSSEKQATAYNKAIHNHPELKLVAVGEYIKLRRNGEVSNMGKYPMPPEIIYIYNKSGNVPENLPPTFEIKALDPRYINGKNNYKTQKAVELVDSLLEFTTKEGDSVLDTFAGSGIFSSQAVLKGRKATAIEIDENVVNNRIKPSVETALQDNASGGQNVLTTNGTRPAKPYPEFKKHTDGVVIKIQSFGRDVFVPFLEEYKGRDIVMAGEDVAIWDRNKKTLFRVGLDETKSSGSRVINEEDNTVENAKKYIDWLDKDVEDKTIAKKPFKEMSSIKAILSIIPKKSSLEILNFAHVSNGFIESSDLGVSVRLKTDLEDGMYKIVGTDPIKTDKKEKDFPKIPEVSGDSVLSIDTEDFSEIMRKMLLSIDKKSTRDQLKGVFVGRNSIIATDSFILTINKIQTSNKEIVISYPHEVYKVLRALGEKIDIILDKNNNIFLKGKNGYVVVKNINEKYPDIVKIIKEFNTKISIDKKEFVKAIKDITPYIKEANFIGVVIDYDENNKQFILSTNSEDIKKSISINANIETVKTEKETISNGMLIMPMDIKDINGKGIVFSIDYLKKSLEMSDDTLHIYKSDEFRTPYFFSGEKIENAQEETKEPIKEAVIEDHTVSKKQNTKIGQVIVDIVEQNDKDINDKDLYLKIENGEYMPLTIENIGGNQISLSHTYIQNGDVMYDPEVIFNIVNGQLEADTIENSGSRFGKRRFIDKNDDFLKLWATNIKDQGFFKKKENVNKADEESTDFKVGQEVYYNGEKSVVLQSWFADNRIVYRIQEVNSRKTRTVEKGEITKDKIENTQESRKKYTRKEIEELVLSKDTGFTEEEKDILRQYEGSGGQKDGQGNGVLDEYYTPQVIVDKIWSLVNQYVDGKIENVLEPSIGTGRFLKEAPKNAKVSGFEINPISAKISSILYPNANIENKSFETLFIDEKGHKKTPQQQYDVVIGNPPYGEHRGKYKGLGEETKIGRYEEYFVKRALDITREGGIVAMVLPSGFLRSKGDYSKDMISVNGTLIDAYRLPNKSFDNTEIGTDIVIFKKNTAKNDIYKITRSRTISNDMFFRDVMNQEKILGKSTTKKGRFGLENYVEGTLEEAIKKFAIDDIVAGEQAIEEFENEDKELVEKEQPLTPKIKEEAIKKTKIAKTRKTKAVTKGKDGGIKGLFTRDKEQKYKVIGVKKGNTKTFSQGGDLTEYEKKIYSLTEEDGTIDPNKLTQEEKSVLNYSNGNYVSDFNYFQGDIYGKLETLEQDKSEMSEEAYNRQKNGLTDILPKPMSIKDITILPIDRLAKEITTESGDTLASGYLKWLRELPYEALYRSNVWEIEAYIQGNAVRGGSVEQNREEKTRRRKVGNKLFKKYYQEELSENDQKKIEKKFNETFNSYHLPDYSKYPLSVDLFDTFYDNPFQIRDIQMRGASFLSNKGVGLLAYEVGVGKTLSGIVAIKSVLDKGWAKKPLIVVPKNLKTKWIKDLTQSMPNIKINDLSNLGGDFKYSGDTKDLKIEDGTISIIAEDGFKRIGFSNETYSRITANLQDVMYQNKPKSARKTAIDNTKIDSIIGLARKKTDFSLTFEELGFDHITIDEAHRAKNIFSKADTSKEKGKSNEYGAIHGAMSERGLKTYLATQYVLEQNRGRNVFLLTATPFNNSPIEIYSMLCLMAKNRFEQLGIKNINDFISMFTELESRYAVKANGSIELTDQVRKFSNLQQLQKLVREYIDFVTGEEAGIPRPEKKKLTPYLKMNTLQATLIEKAQELFSTNFAREGGTLRGISEMQKITLSPYLSSYSDVTIDSVSAKDLVENSPKIKYTVESILQAHKANPHVGQIIFAEKGIEIFKKIREHFIKNLGYKESEVDIIDSSVSNAVKDEIQQKFQNGDIRILLASGTVKEGVDLQKNSTDLYNLYLAWNPTDMIQAEGRTWRQGSFYDKVRIHYPLIENSVDKFLFQKLEEKASRIANVFSYKGDSLDVSDIDFEGMKFDLITDPVIKVKAKYKYDTSELNNKITLIESDIAYIERRISNVVNIENKIKDYKEYEQSSIQNNDEQSAGYYRRKVTEKQLELNEEIQKLEKKGYRIEDITSQSAGKKEELKKLREKETALSEKFNVELKEAENTQVDKLSGENDYNALTSEMSDKSFFTHKSKMYTGDINVFKESDDISISAYINKVIKDKEKDDTKYVNQSVIQGGEKIKHKYGSAMYISDKDRGIDNMKKALIEQYSQKRISFKEYKQLSILMDRLKINIDDSVLVFSNEENDTVNGYYEFSKQIARIFNNSMKDKAGIKGTVIHEIWHGASQYLPKKDFDILKNEFIKQRDNFFKSGEFDTTVDQLLETGNQEDNDTYLEILDAKTPEEKIRLLGTNGRAYRFTDLDEFIAESMRDLSEEEFKYETKLNSDSLLSKIILAVKRIMRAFVETVALTESEKNMKMIFRSFWKGKNTVRNFSKGMERELRDRGENITAISALKTSKDKPLIVDGKIKLVDLYKKVYSDLYEDKAPAFSSLEDNKIIKGVGKQAFTLGKRYATKLTKDNYKDVQKEIRNYIIKNIPPKYRGELIRAVINAKSKADVEMVIAKVDEMVEKGKGREIAVEKKKLMSEIYTIFLNRGMTGWENGKQKVKESMLQQAIRYVSKDGRYKMSKLNMEELGQLKEIANTLTQDKEKRIRILSESKIKRINDLLPESLQGKELITLGDIEQSFVNTDITGSLLGLHNVNFYRASRLVMIKNEITKKMYDKFSTAERHFISEYEEFVDRFAKLYQEASGKMTKFRSKEMDERIIGYLENRLSPDVLTEKEMRLANEIIQFYASSLEVMKPKRLRKYYFTHTRENFLEAVKSVGFKNAIGEFFSQQFIQDIYKDLPTDVAANLEFIIANNVFNPFGQPRVGKRYSQDLRKAFQIYGRVFFMKKNFDRLYSQSNAVMNLLPKNMQVFFRRYVQSAKGRPEGTRYNPQIKWALDMAVTFEYIKLLGLNIASGIFNVTVGTVDNLAVHGIFTEESLVKGNLRYITPKGFRLINKYHISSRSVTYEMTQLMNMAGEKVNALLFFQLGMGEHYLRGTGFLSLLTKEEYNSGVVSDSRMSEIRHILGESQPLYGQFDSPVYSRHAFGKTMYMFMTWLPTRLENWANWVSGATKALKNEDGLQGKFIENKDLHKILRWGAAFILMSLMFGDTDRWKRQMEDYKDIFSIQYWIDLMNPTTKPVWKDLMNFGAMIGFIMSQERYTKSGSDYRAGDYKWEVYGKRIIEPTTVKRIEQGKNPFLEGWTRTERKEEKKSIYSNF